MIFSIGHSTLEMSKFLTLIEEIDVVWDVRSHPTSKWPQFHKEEMERWLPLNGKRYVWEPRLGGWTEKHEYLMEEMQTHGVDLTPYLTGKFPKQRIAANRGDFPLFESKPSWTNVGLYDYSWFQSLPEFVAAGIALIETGKITNVGIMCCEALWWRCHRSMISDFVVFKGNDVIHLQPKKTMHSKVIGNRLQRYDGEIIERWR